MNVTENTSLDTDIMSDDDNDELEEESLDLEKSFANKELSSKRDIRAEIERKLELLELKKLTGDSVYDDFF